MRKGSKTIKGSARVSPKRKKDKKAALDQKIERLMKRALPGVRQQFHSLVRKAERFDGRQPATLRAEIEQQVSVLLEQIDFQNADFLGDLLELVKDGGLGNEVNRFFADTGHLAQKDASSDDRYELLMRLVNEAHARVPFSPSIVLQEHADPNVMFELQCAPADLIHQAEQESGEIRATAVTRALREVAEPPYKLYLSRIWLLSYLREGEWPTGKNMPSLGTLVRETAHRLTDYPSLIDLDAGWMRNAVSHNRRVYHPNVDAVELWDIKKSARCIPVGKLLEKVKSMYQLSAITMPRVAQVYLFETMLSKSGMLAAVIEEFAGVSSLDEAQRQKAERAIDEKAKVQFGPLNDFLNSHVKNREQSTVQPTTSKPAKKNTK